jgi:hypothetical protein
MTGNRQIMTLLESESPQGLAGTARNVVMFHVSFHMDVTAIGVRVAQKGSLVANITIAL